MVLHILKSRDVNKYYQYFLHFSAPFLSIYLLHYFPLYRDIFHVEGQVTSMVIDNPTFIQIDQDYDLRRKRTVFYQCLYVKIIEIDPNWCPLLLTTYAHLPFNVCDQENRPIFTSSSKDANKNLVT